MRPPCGRGCLRLASCVRLSRAPASCPASCVKRYTLCATCDVCHVQPSFQRLIVYRYSLAVFRPTSPTLIPLHFATSAIYHTHVAYPMLSPPLSSPHCSPLSSLLFPLLTALPSPHCSPLSSLLSPPLSSLLSPHCSPLSSAGDFFAIGYNAEAPWAGLGFGAGPEAAKRHEKEGDSGPCITSGTNLLCMCVCVCVFSVCVCVCVCVCMCVCV
jgi:hypothetical protein